VAQGSELNLIDIRFYTNASDVYFVEDNEPIEDLNTNLLIVDNKAILAKDTAQQAQTDFAAHQGGGGSGAHGPATTTVAGFMTVADKIKLDSIQTGASVNTISAPDAIELVGKGETELHRHPNGDPSRKGFLASVDKTKLDGIQTNADVNNVTPANAAILTDGPLSNATALHTHVQPSFTEVFDETAHFAHDHTGLQGITVFSGIIGAPFTNSVTISTTGAFVQGIFTQPFGFTISALNGGFRRIFNINGSFQRKTCAIDNVEVVGNTGIITFSVVESGPVGGSHELSVWMGAAGL